MSAQHMDSANGNGKHAMNGHSTCKNIIGGPSAAELEASWKGNLRWRGITRPYSGEDVVRLRGSIQIEYTLARLGAERLWNLLHSDEYVAALGAMSGNQAVQQVKAGLKAVYLSGWQVAADANLAGQMYPDQSLYPANSVPHVVKRINQAFQRADQIQTSEGKDDTYWYAPIVADAEAGFGGPLNVFELMKSMIEAGAAGVHFEDQLSSEKKCGHMGGKVLVPTQTAIKHLVSARLAADVSGVPTLVIARTDANGAHLITSDIDPTDHKFLTGERTPEGFYKIRSGLDAAIARGLSYAPYCDLIWCETAEPNLKEAQRFADEIHAQFPGKLLAYNCSPSFNYSMFKLARGYSEHGMAAYSKLQQAEFALENDGYTATKHQREVGTGYFDEVAQVIAGGESSTTALAGSTEMAQFH
jgi:isocitrate lyase